MPKQYEDIRDSYISRGMSPKKAKSIAAATWNKLHPDDTNPWDRKSESEMSPHKSKLHRLFGRK